MNDYEIARFSKIDIREFWSQLVEQKSILQEQLKQENNEERKQFISGQIKSLQTTLKQLEVTFALF